MKTVLIVGLVVELVIGALFFMGLISPVSTQAQTDESELTTVLPDFEKIYHAALTAPLQEVEKEIEDEEIAEFYHRLIQRYDLDEP